MGFGVNNLYVVLPNDCFWVFLILDSLLELGKLNPHVLEGIIKCGDFDCILSDKMPKVI